MSLHAKIVVGLFTFGLAGVGIVIFGSLILGISRNPRLKDDRFCLALDLIEAISLFALMISFLILFV